MLNSKKLSTRLWAKAVNTSCYTINRVFLRQGTNKTSYEIWKDDSRKDEGIYLVDEAENQLQKSNVTPDVVTQDVEENKTEPSVATTSATKVVTNIFDPTIRDPPIRIEKNHPTENIIGDLTDGVETRG